MSFDDSIIYVKMHMIFLLKCILLYKIEKLISFDFKLNYSYSQ